MAQHIWVKINNSDEDSIVVDINFADIYNSLNADTDLTYLSRIDPYDDTSFEGMEVKYLICDLNQVKDIPQVNELIKLLSEASKVVFVWD